MKKWMIVVLALLVLTGCAQDPNQTENTAPSDPSDPTEPTQAYYLPVSAAERNSGGAIRAYQLDSGITGLTVFGDGLLLCLDSGTLQLLDGQTLEPIRQRELECALSWNQPSLLIRQDRLAYYDAQANDYVVLDEKLVAISTVPMEQELQTDPLMTGDCSAIFYTDGTGIRVLDLTSGSTRLLRQESSQIASLDGLVYGDSVLRYTRLLEDGATETCFIDAETGSLCFTAEYQGHTVSWGDKMAGILKLDHPLGQSRRIVTGEQNGQLLSLTPTEGWDSALFPGDAQVLVQYETEEGLRLELYSLEDGALLSQMSLPHLRTRFAFASAKDGKVWLSDGASGTFYCWDTARSAPEQSSTALAPLATLSQPDADAMAQLSIRAAEISSVHRVNISFAEDSNRAQGQTYEEYLDYRAEFYGEALTALDTILNRFPADFLYNVGKTTDSGLLQIQLVDDFDPATDRVAGTAECDYSGGELTLRLSMSPGLMERFFHELFHAMEVRIMNTGNGLKNWNSLNPEGFAYYNSYEAYHAGNLPGSEYLTQGSNYFADAYAMVNAREDRAQVFLYAMLSGQADRFASEHMQAKLRLICAELRSTFHISADTVPEWEQYLLPEEAADPTEPTQ